MIRSVIGVNSEGIAIIQGIDAWLRSRSAAVNFSAAPAITELVGTHTIVSALIQMGMGQ